MTATVRSLVLETRSAIELFLGFVERNVSAVRTNAFHERMGALLDQILERADKRNRRQSTAFAFVKATFGPINAGPEERARRIIEEAIELAQAERISLADIERTARHVYAKPAGEPRQEAGGLGLTLLAYAESRGFSADDAERDELDRVLSLDRDFFRKRHDAKAEAGIARKCDT